MSGRNTNIDYNLLILQIIRQSNKSHCSSYLNDNLLDLIHHTLRAFWKEDKGLCREISNKKKVNVGQIRASESDCCVNKKNKYKSVNNISNCRLEASAHNISFCSKRKTLELKANNLSIRIRNLAHLVRSLYLMIWPDLVNLYLQFKFIWSKILRIFWLFLERHITSVI